MVVSPFLGLIVDRYRLGVRSRLLLATAASLLTSLSLLALSLGRVARSQLTLVALCMSLGVGYAVGQTMVWATITLVAPEHAINIAGGFAGTAVNLIPTILPALVFTGEVPLRSTPDWDMLMLALSAALGALALGVAAVFATSTLAQEASLLQRVLMRGSTSMRPAGRHRNEYRKVGSANDDEGDTDMMGNPVVLSSAGFGVGMETIEETEF